MALSTASHELKRSAQTQRLTEFAVNVAAEAMFTVDPTGRILSVNETACDRLEYTRDELLGMSVADIDPDYPAELWPVHFDELRCNGKMTFETRHRAKSGRIIDVEVSVAYFQFDGLEYCCSSIRDITERKQAEHILRLQHEVLAKVASTSGALSETLDALCRFVEELVPDALATVMLVDPSDGNLRFEAGPGLTETIRQAFEPLKPGFEAGSCGAAAFLKRPVFVEDTRTSPHWERLQHIVEQLNLLACWSLPILDERNQTLGTFAITHQQATSPSDFHRQILETSSHMASIAIRRTRFEQQLQIAHEELAHVSRMSTIGELASSIAHELNQPLAAMANHTFVLEQQSQVESPDLASLRQHAANIREQTMRAGDIVSSMRSLIKKTAPTRVRVHPSEIVQRSLVLLEPELRLSGILLQKNLKESVPTLHVDSVQIQQVLVNLVRNAIDAMQEASREERVLTVMTDINDANEVEICVSDTGNGLRDDELELVFDAFHTTKQKGMGMGLAISRSIAEAHSGRLTAGHADDRGAVFRMTLPFAADEP
jgi:PAS domain S-box-containing protein